MSILEAFIAGKEARRQADAAAQVGALQQYLAQNGQAIFGGDMGAIGGLAGMGPQGLEMAMGMRDSMDQRARMQKADSRDDQQWQMQLEEYKAGKTKEQLAADAAEIESAIAGGLAVKTPQEWDAYVESKGAPELKGKFEQREALARGMMSVAESFKMNAPKEPDLTASQKDYKFYAEQEVAAGRSPLSFNDWDLQGKKATAATTTVTVGGASPQDVATHNKTVKSDNVNEVIGDIKKTIESAFLPTAGLGGSIASGIPGTAAHDIASNLDTLRAAASFSSLQAMREASKTGAALGAVSDTEIRLLGSELANLEQSQSPEQFMRNLERFQRTYNEIVHGPQAVGSGPVVIDGFTIEEIP